MEERGFQSVRLEQARMIQQRKYPKNLRVSPLHVDEWKVGMAGTSSCHESKLSTK